MKRRRHYLRRGLFSDPQGNKSSTRVKTFLAALTAFAIALVSVFVKEITPGDSLPVIITLLTFSSGEKSFQAYLESKINKPE